MGITKKNYRKKKGGVSASDSTRAPSPDGVLEGEVLDADRDTAAISRSSRKSRPQEEESTISSAVGEQIIEAEAILQEDIPDESAALELAQSGGEIVEVEAEALDDVAIDPEGVSESDESEVESKVRKTPAASSHGLVKYDTVEAYLREIRAYPPISREEEHELAVRYVQDKDLTAAYKLVTSNLWLVVKLARDYEKAARGLLDLVQEGNIGLMEAVKNYDPFRGVRFPSYAVWWIKAYIVRYLIANWRLVKIGTTQAQRKLFFNLKKEKERLEREGFSVGPKLLAERLNVKVSEVVEMEQRLGSSDMSVDAPLSTQDGDSGSDMLSVLPAPQSNAEELLDQRQMKSLIQEGLEAFTGSLKEKERIIFLERMLGEEKATLQDISEKVGVSRERVRQIENRLRERLKAFLKDRLGAELDSMEF